MAKGVAYFLALLFFASFLCADKAYCEHVLGRNNDLDFLQLIFSFAKARSLQKMGLLDEPIKSFQGALDLARKAADANIEAECLMALAILSWDKGEVDLSSEYFSKALKISQMNGLKNNDVFCRTALSIHLLFNEAKKQRIKKNYTKAKDKYSQAISLARKIKSINHEVKCLRQMSTIYFDSYRLFEYFEANNKALELARKYKILREEGFCSYNIALYFIKNGNFNRSFYLLNRSLAVAIILDDLEDKIDCYYLIGFMFCEQGNYESSLSYLQQALSIAKDNRKKIELYNAIGIALKRYAAKLNSEKYYEANRYYRKALNLANSCQDIALEVIALNNIGSSYIAQRKYRKALLYLREGLKKIDYIDRLDNKSIVLTNTGNAYYEIKNYSQSKRYFFRAIKILNNDEIPRLLWEPFFGLGRCFEKENKLDLAIFYYKKAVSMLDKIDQSIKLDFDRANFISDKFKAREALIRLLYLKILKSNNYQPFKNELLLYIDKSKPMALLDQASETFEDNKNTTNVKISMNEESIMPMARADKNDQPSLWHAKKKGSLNNWLDEPKPPLADKGNNNQPAIFVYSIGEEISILAVIMNSDIKYYRLPSRAHIEKSIRGYLKFVSSPLGNRLSGEKAAKRILNEIFYPILEPQFRGIKKIIIIPDGLLFYLPFETLILNGSFADSPTFMIEKYDISYAPSLSFLYNLNQKSLERNNDVRCLIIGNPDYSTFGKRGENRYSSAAMDMLESQGFFLDPLPFTKKEAILIKNTIKSKESLVWLNKEANEDNIKRMDLKKYSIIHFACHGFIDEEAPTRSALVLSYKQGSAQDGLLQVAEIYDLELQADLVVLSACQTGRGQIARGEGILGLAKTFFYSGARSVISTLWNINDISTAIFMKDFYRFLYAGMTKSEALRSAKVKMIRSRYGHPFYWGAFILNGDYRSRFYWH